MARLVIQAYIEVGTQFLLVKKPLGLRRVTIVGSYDTETAARRATREFSAEVEYTKDKIQEIVTLIRATESLDKQAELLSELQRYQKDLLNTEFTEYYVLEVQTKRL